MDQLRGAPPACPRLQWRLEPLLDIHGIEMRGDLAVEPGHRVGQCRGWRDDGEPAVDTHTRREFTDVGRSGRAGKRASGLPRRISAFTLEEPGR